MEEACPVRSPRGRGSRVQGWRKPPVKGPRGGGASPLRVSGMEEPVLLGVPGVVEPVLFGVPVEACILRVEAACPVI